MKRVLDDILSEFTTSSLERLKWSVNISLQWICSHLQNVDNYRVIELMHKSSGDTLKMMIETLTNVPRHDLVKQLQDFNPQKEHSKTFVLEALRKLNKTEYNKFISTLEEELPKLWKQRLEEAELSQVIELMETMFSQDPSLRTAALMEKVSPSLDVSYLKLNLEDLTDTFGILSLAEFEKLRPHLKSFLPHISEHELNKCKNQDIIGLMEQNSFQNCVQMTEKVLKRMDRPDLVKKLFDRSSRAGVQFRPESGRSELLLETLLDLSMGEWLHFQRTFAKRPYMKEQDSTKQMDRQEFVSWIVREYGLESVTMVADVLVEMGLSEYAHRCLSYHQDPTKESSSYMRWWFMSIGDIFTQRKILLDTVHYFRDRELCYFEWCVQFTCLHKGFSWLHLESERQSQEFQIMSIECCPLTAKEACAAMIRAVTVKHCSDDHSLSEIMQDVFIHMNRRDFAEQLWGIATGEGKLEIKPALKIKVEEMVIDINRLMKTLGHLNVKELADLKRSLSSGAHSAAPWYRLCHYEVSQLVFFIIQTFGQKSVDVTKNLLESIGRTDLKQRLHSTLSEHFQDAWWAKLIQKIAIMAAVNEVFGQTLLGLRDEDLKHFKKQFVLTTIFRESPRLDLRVLAITGAEETGTLLLHTFGWAAVETAYWVLKAMKRNDLAQNLQQTIAFSTGNKPRKNVAAVKDLRERLSRLCQFIIGLSHTDSNVFQTILQKIQSKLNIVWLFDKDADADDIVDIILEICGQHSMSIITDLLEEINREDLLLEYLGPYDRHGRVFTAQSKVSANLKRRIQDILKELTDNEDIQVFRKSLQTSCESNLPRRLVQSYLRVFPRLSDLVDLLVAIYGESSSLETIQTALTEMRKNNPAPKTSVTSSASKALTESMEVDSGTCQMDVWTKIDPEVEETERQFTYRLPSGAGCYECSVSGLRWSCKESVTFLYTFVSWEQHMDRMEAMKYMPAGPLIDISVKCGRLDEVYLPHWLCIESPDTQQKMAVLHIDDCGDIVEKVTNASATHVKLPEPIFSPRAVLIKLGFRGKIHCSILIYKTDKAFLTLHVYLIPRDPGLKESLDRIEQQHGYSIIRKPHPDKSLKHRDKFILSANMVEVEIIPQKLKLRYQIPPNFFEVYSKNPDFDFELKLSQDNDSVPVWSCRVRQDDYAERASVVSCPHGAAFVNHFQKDLIQRVTNVAQILDELKDPKVKVISDEVYNSIRRLATSQEKMREIFCGPLRSSGDKGKEIFYNILKEQQPYLVKDLEKSFCDRRL